MNPTIEWKKTQPGSTEAVQFSDGMLVTAEDLTAAMRYPLSVIQVLLKAYFGCGIVCGLDLKNPAEEQAADGQPAEGQAAEGQAAETTNAQRGSTGGARKKASPECDPNFILTVEKGVALGCDGYPIEICGPLKLDLTPDPCRLDRRPKEMFVAARRVTAAEAAARPCGCGSTGGEPAQQCTRMRDHALVQAFDEDRLPAELCRAAASSAKASAAVAQPKPAQPQPHQGGRPTGVAAVCDCLKQCDEYACCGEPWVLLGSVVVSEQGLGAIDRSGRRHVKPIACICAASERDQVEPPVRVEVKPKVKTPPETRDAAAAGGAPPATA